jgi:hypothetical protein
MEDDVMSYADDLAKDRDKYLLQRNQLMSALEEVLTTRSQKAKIKAQRLMRKIERSDPIANAVEALVKDGREDWDRSFKELSDAGCTVSGMENCCDQDEGA